MSPIGDHICHCQGCNCKSQELPWNELPISRSIEEEQKVFSVKDIERFAKVVEAWSREEISSEELRAIITSTPIAPRRGARLIDVASLISILAVVALILLETPVAIVAGLAIITGFLTLASILR